MRMGNGNLGGHNIVLYKYNNQVYFLNPQGKSDDNPSKIFNSTNINDLFRDTTWIIGLGYYTISNLKNPKPLVDTSCPINFSG